ncbi:MAG: tRNA (N6-isopentenyl adenosine(37)-C2)-methylthiotransferase MiaB [Calditrichaeota bacterium]|nr:MAG: tRNA (N6-isopentenyl adenosine(37)-C2)-methylthiotransferase MiaB [Calditrichota bacterium]
MVKNSKQGEKRVYLETFGCQMNAYDSELIKAILEKNDYKFVTDTAGADVVLLNTCAIREHAHQKIYHRLNQLKGQKRRGEIQIVGVLGCMAQNLRKELVERSPQIDIVAGPDSYKRLPALIEMAMQKGEKAFDFSLSEYETYTDIAPRRLPGVNAWIAISRGCDNFCTFCVVPYTRGRERSRPPESILAEAHQVVAEGFKQITLLGQNVNSYRYEQYDFSDLMEMMAGVPGLKRVRFTSPHPKDFPRRLLQVIADSPNLCHHIHLPLQAGSDRVLERMNRTYTQKEFLQLVDDIRRIIPDVSLTTDVICGFCGETEEDFEQTIQVMRQVEFDAAFIFKYSERKNTIAARKFADDVPEEVKTERVMRLNELQRRISKKRNQAEIGKIYEVLIESRSKKRADEWLGRTDQNKGVVFSAPHHQPGDFVKVRITDAGTHTLMGELLPEEKRLPVLTTAGDMAVES